MKRSGLEARVKPVRRCGHRTAREKRTSKWENRGGKVPFTTAKERKYT